MAAGRRLAKRAVLVQAAATLLLSMALLIAGPGYALGSLVGGGGLALGNAAAAWLGMDRDAPGAGYAIGRLFLGLVVKWILVVAVLLLGIGTFNLPATGILAGLLVSMVAFYVAAGTSTRH